MSTESVEVLDFRDGNEEKQLETMAEKPEFTRDSTTAREPDDFVEVIRFRHFAKHWQFSKDGKNGLKKEVLHSVNVSVVMDLV